MDALEKWMENRLNHTIPNHNPLPKWMFSQKLRFKSALLLVGKYSIKVRPPNNSNDLCLLFCLY